MNTDIKMEKLLDMAIRNVENRSDRDIKNCKVLRYFDTILMKVRDENSRRIREEIGIIEIDQGSCEDCDENECII